MLEINGILRHVSNIETIDYNNKSLKKRTFIIEIINGIYPQKIAFDLYNDKCLLLNNCRLELPIMVKFVPKSTESKGKWFTSLTAYELSGEALNNLNNILNEEEEEYASNDLPF